MNEENLTDVSTQYLFIDMLARDCLKVYLEKLNAIKISQDWAMQKIDTFFAFMTIADISLVLQMRY